MVEISTEIKDEGVRGPDRRNRRPRPIPEKTPLRRPESTLLLFAALLVERTLPPSRPGPLVQPPVAGQPQSGGGGRVARLLSAERNFPRRHLGAEQLQDPDPEGVFPE